MLPDVLCALRRVICVQGRGTADWGPAAGREGSPDVGLWRHLMLFCEKACAVPLRMRAHCSSSVVVKNERRPRLQQHKHKHKHKHT